MSEMGLGVPLPDDPTDPDPSAYDGMSDEDIESALGGGPPRRESTDDLVDVSETEPESTPDPEPVAVTAEEPTKDQVVEPEPEVAVEEPPDPMSEIRSEIDRVREQYEAKLELQRAHNSRLAGEIGHLRSVVSKARTEPTPDFSTTETDDAAASLAERLDRIERSKMAEDADRARAEVISAHTSSPDLQELQPYVAKAAEQYASDWTAALDAQDPSTARLLTSAVLKNVIADARALKYSADKERAQKARADQAASLRAKKVAAAPPGSGASKVAAPKRARSLSELSDADLEKAADAYVESLSR